MANDIHINIEGNPDDADRAIDKVKRKLAELEAQQKAMAAAERKRIADNQRARSDDNSRFIKETEARARAAKKISDLEKQQADLRRILGKEELGRMGEQAKAEKQYISDRDKAWTEYYRRRDREALASASAAERASKATARQAEKDARDAVRTAERTARDIERVEAASLKRRQGTMKKIGDTLFGKGFSGLDFGRRGIQPRNLAIGGLVAGALGGAGPLLYGAGGLAAGAAAGVGGLALGALDVKALGLGQIRQSASTIQRLQAEIATGAIKQQKGLALIRTELKLMTPEQRSALKVWQAWSNVIQGVSSRIQRNMLPAIGSLSGAIRANKGTIQTALVGSSADLGKQIRGFGSMLETKHGKAGLAAFAQESRVALNAMAGSLTHIISGFLGMARAAKDFTRNLFGAGEGLTKFFDKWANSAKGQAQLHTFFDRAYTSIKLVLGAAGQLVRVLALFTSDSFAAGKGGFKGLTGLLKQAGDFLASTKGKADVASFWHGVGQAFQIIGTSLKQAGPYLLGFLHTAVQAMKIIANIVQYLQKIPGIGQTINGVFVTALILRFSGLLGIVKSIVAQLAKMAGFKGVEGLAKGGGLGGVTPVGGGKVGKVIGAGAVVAATAALAYQGYQDTVNSGKVTSDLQKMNEQLVRFKNTTGGAKSAILEMRGQIDKLPFASGAQRVVAFRTAMADMAVASSGHMRRVALAVLNLSMKIHAVPNDVQILAILHDHASGPAKAVKAAVDNIPSSKSVTITANTAAFMAAVNNLPVSKAIHATNILKGPRTFPAGGGRIPGAGNMDTVPAMLTPGEVVLNREQQAAFGGPDVFKRMFGQRFAKGGIAAGANKWSFYGPQNNPGTTEGSAAWIIAQAVAVANQVKTLTKREHGDEADIATLKNKARLSSNRDDHIDIELRDHMGDKGGPFQMKVYKTVTTGSGKKGHPKKSHQVFDHYTKLYLDLHREKDENAINRRKWATTVRNDRADISSVKQKLAALKDPFTSVPGYDAYQAAFLGFDSDAALWTDSTDPNASQNWIKDLESEKDITQTRINTIRALLGNKDITRVPTLKGLVQQEIIQDVGVLQGIFSALNQGYQSVSDTGTSTSDNTYADMVAQAALDAIGQARLSGAIQSTDLQAVQDFLQGRVARYATGAQYVPRDQLAMVHRGEQIVPASEREMSGTMDSHIHVSVGATDKLGQMIADHIDIHQGRKAYRLRREGRKF